MLHMWCSHRPHPLASPCVWRKLLVSSCLSRGQYSPLFLLLGGGGSSHAGWKVGMPGLARRSRVGSYASLVTSWNLLFQKLSVAATVRPNRNFTKLSMTAGSGDQHRFLSDQRFSPYTYSYRAKHLYEQIHSLTGCYGGQAHWVQVIVIDLLHCEDHICFNCLCFICCTLILRHVYRMEKSIQFLRKL